MREAFREHHHRALEREADDAELQVVACGMHLADTFGATWRAIEADGFKIAAKVDLEIGDDSAAAVARSASAMDAKTLSHCPRAV